MFEGGAALGGSSGSSSERKVSRAEVLDMARRHIKLLEREYAVLKDERDELRGNVERLRWYYSRCESADMNVSSLDQKPPPPFSAKAVVGSM